MAMAAPAAPPPIQQGNDTTTGAILTIAIPDAIILLAGFGLIAVSQWQESIVPMWDLISNGKIPSKGGSQWLLMGGEVVFIFILAMLSDISPGMSQLVFAFIFALWMVWMVKNPDALKTVFNAAGLVQGQVPPGAQIPNPFNKTLLPGKGGF